VIQRVFDLVTATIGGVVLIPVFAAVALLILVTSGRPVLFRQPRGGLYGRNFEMVKFRTMTVPSDPDGGSFNAGDTLRVTPIGRFLRRTKLDEIPQLWNVLKGDMSIVGPRPEVRKWIDAYPDAWSRVHRVRPGITDPASLVYRHEETLLGQSSDPESTYRDEILPHKLRLYEEYARNRTLLQDIGIVAQTIAALFRSR
jgi:lipopolysaccharide/colanic/teichoic acid biosynthesis glycosyltransferase